MFEFLNLFLLIFLAIIICCNSNPMYSVFSFIFLILVLAIYLILHGIEFVGLAILIIYIGAIMVLFVFVIFMLDLNTRAINDNKIIIFSNNVFINLVGLFALVKGFMISRFVFSDLCLVIIKIPGNATNNYISIFRSGKIKVSPLFSFDINIIGYKIFTEYVVYLYLCGVILFIALVGSVFIIAKMDMGGSVKK